MPETIADLGLRWSIQRDLPDMLAIEAASFAQPWTEDEFRHMLRQRSCIGLVAERREQAEFGSTFRTVGYVVYQLTDHAVAILNLAVAPAERRNGVGSFMVGKLKSKLRSNRRRRLLCNVHDGNLMAHLFLRSCGLQAVEVLRGYSADGSDAYLFSYELED